MLGITKKTTGPVNAPASEIPSAPPSTPDNGGGGLPTSLAGVAQKRRGVKPGTKRGPYRSGTPEKPTAGSAASLPDAVPVFTEANTKILINLPFKLAFVKTGWTGFLLSPVEEETLLSTGVNVFNQWVAIDPKYVSLTLFSLSLLTIAGEKVFTYRAALAEYLKQQAVKPPEKVSETSPSVSPLSPTPEEPKP